MTRTEVIRVLSVVAAGFPSFQVVAEVVEAWAELLREDDAGEVRDAARRFIRGQVEGRNHAFAPSIAELLAEVQAGRARAAAVHRESILKLEADNREAERKGDEAKAQAMRKAGYTQYAAFTADERTGTLASIEDAPHRRYSPLLRRTYDARVESPINGKPIARGAAAPVASVLPSLADAPRTVSCSPPRMSRGRTCKPPPSNAVPSGPLPEGAGADES